ARSLSQRRGSQSITGYLFF
ncbi:MAG: hypothetical protein AVDCRST_MAG95-3092, partial [uncultured Adhaeribacter sp.]